MSFGVNFSARIQDVNVDVYLAETSGKRSTTLDEWARACLCHVCLYLSVELCVSVCVHVYCVCCLQRLVSANQKVTLYVAETSGRRRATRSVRATPTRSATR